MSKLHPDMITIRSPIDKTSTEWFPLEKMGCGWELAGHSVTRDDVENLRITVQYDDQLLKGFLNLLHNNCLSLSDVSRGASNKFWNPTQTIYIRPADIWCRESAVAVIVGPDGRFLTVRDGTRIGFPGGKVNPGEKVLDTVTRELQEELGAYCPFVTSDRLGTWYDFPDQEHKGRSCTAFVASSNRLVWYGSGEFEPIWSPFTTLIESEAAFPEFNQQVITALCTRATLYTGC